MSKDNLLRLAALDNEDLKVLSAHLQDAIVKVSDITWQPVEKRLVVALNRFVWEADPIGWGRRKVWERRRSVLHFERVESVRALGIDRNQGEEVLELLVIRFDESEPPSGTVQLVFSGDITLKLDVDVLEARLTDLGPAWATSSLPQHS